jgi:hypothetical protein
LPDYLQIPVAERARTLSSQVPHAVMDAGMKDQQAEPVVEMTPEEQQQLPNFVQSHSMAKKHSNKCVTCFFCPAWRLAWRSITVAGRVHCHGNMFMPVYPPAPCDAIGGRCMFSHVQ